MRRRQEKKLIRNFSLKYCTIKITSIKRADPVWWELYYNTSQGVKCSRLLRLNKKKHQVQISGRNRSFKRKKETNDN